MINYDSIQKNQDVNTHSAPSSAEACRLFITYSFEHSNTIKEDRSEDVII